MDRAFQSQCDANRIVPVLSASPFTDDHATLERILNGSEANWDIVKSDNAASAIALVRQRLFQIVICEHDLPGGSWIALLDHLVSMPARMSLIVTSRFAD